MGEEKEIVRKIRNSMSAKKSRAEIIRKLQNKGYKLEYIDALLKKASAPKKIIIVFSIIFLTALVLTLISYIVFFQNEKSDLKNPLEGLKINFESRFSIQDSESNQENYLEDIEINEEFISYLLNEIGAWKLRTSPISFKKPIINFKIDDLDFNSVIGKSIITTKGHSKSADMQFNTNKEDIVRAIVSNDAESVFRDSLKNKRTEVVTFATKTELFAKGYLGLYESLK